MSPRTGRPKKPDARRIVINLRLTEKAASDLKECAEYYDTSRTTIVERGIELVKAEKEKTER